jgi:F-type H+-transporting ATPase subunit gamma
MAVGKEIRTKISSVQSTQKITKAMEMVAASKMRRAQELMAAGKPYSKHIRSVIGHLANATSEFRHKYLKERPEIKRVGYIVVSTDRGLCGGLNINLFKSTLRAMKDWSDKGVEVDLCVIGKKAQSFYGSFGSNIVACITELGDDPSVSDLIGSIKVMLDAFDSGKIDMLFIASNGFVNTMTQKPTVEQLLPLCADEDEKLKHHWDYIYEPDESKLLEGLLRRYIESQTYQAVAENVACEQAARMIAMKNATENAGDIISELKLIYNKARQASITQELSEIVSGASAV